MTLGSANAAPRFPGGQRQRLAIARTLLLAPPILILDDSTSSVDVATEALIQQAMVQVLRGRTSFVIAHRLSTVRRADLILVLDQGRIVEQGAHDDLLQRDGPYRRIHDLQLRPADEHARVWQCGCVTTEVEADGDTGGPGKPEAARNSTSTQERQTRYWRTLLWMIRHFRPYRGRLALAVVAMLAYSGTVVALPWTVKQAIDHLGGNPWRRSCSASPPALDSLASSPRLAWPRVCFIAGPW